MVFPGGSDGKKICLQCGRPGFDPWVGKKPWRRAWQPTPVFLPGESPWTEEPGRLQSMGSQRVRHDWVTKHTHTHTHTHILQLNKKKNQLQNWQKIWADTLIKARLPTKLMKRCLTLSVIREMPIKITVKYHTACSFEWS